jgi:hypothetical protein
MGDMKAGGRTAMAAKLIADVVTAEHKPAKAGLLADMLDGGVERVGVTDDDGAKLGAVSLTVRGPAPQVVDDRAFLAWVLKRYPDEIVQAVRASFTEKLLAGAKAVGEPIDPATGELIDGVDMVAGEPYLTVRPTAEAKERMRETILASGLLQLTSGDAA